MKTYIVLLRGINVGGKKLLPMKELISLLEQNGFENVETYIQSGNIVLQSKSRPSREIENLIVGKFGFKPEIIVLEKSEFDSAIINNPYNPTEEKFAHFYFCSALPKLDTEKLKKVATESEEYQLKEKVFYLHAPKGIGRSKLVTNLESCLGVPATGRNLNTIKKLSQMVKDA